MEIVRIFADRLTSFRYGTDDEFTRLFRDWQDPEYLFRFFSENAADLQSGFFGTVSLQEAVRRTRDEARALERKLLELAGSSFKNLDHLFIPLQPTEPDDLARSKARGFSKKSWLRIYAIRLEPNAYVVTGGAIKLTRAMQDREHTRHELGMLNRCRDFLREQGISDNLGLAELAI